ncbi:PLP-dependent transferase [Wolfiporia cocos MD-104 SS10]|uniref:PLP-dependent transferase n=1 Tax=Wolfiporia cocos (strain MD-104) TaxID=742152 RepID=A0A2H3JGV9_WOLCO|nr:PLP-dependent transferase [Wolfiporia cocos MD-104 SS10]
MSSYTPIEYARFPDFDKTIGAWFVGPKAENSDILEEQLRKIVRYFRHGRECYFPKDAASITTEMKVSAEFQAAVDKLDQVLEYMSILLAHHTVPFASPRYAAHVSADTTLPSIVGYVLGMLYNQNNVSPEASPLTSVIEYIVGQDICHMLGFNTAEVRKEPENESLPIGWGHVTCDGSVANYESMWYARSLKFYPLSLMLALQEGDLQFAAPTFMVRPTGASGDKLYVECSAWELLNLKQDVILGLGEALARQFDISSDFLDAAVQPYLAQALGKGELEKRFGVKPPKYFNAITKHYSINKAANILGIGESNLVNIDIDDHARMKADVLKQELLKCISEQIPIYAVLAIMGTTEHGAVDPLVDICNIRDELERENGVSFLIHCDAAWGGYFTSILRDPPSGWRERDVDPDFLAKPLLPYTRAQLEYIKHADTVTVDSHKTGYCPYPAGGLCYRDERMRFLITTTSPYINTTGEGVEAMGTYGLEGSKPGAAPLAVWTTNVTLGLHMGGYGTLLSQSIFSGVRYFMLWSTISDDHPTVFVTPFNVLEVPQERKTRIKKSILERSVNEILRDPAAMDDIQTIGSDLMINTFACNFRLSDYGPFNEDVAEANFFNQRIYERLSIRRITDDPNLRPTVLVGTVWEQALYKDCLTHFKAKLHLDSADPLDLHAFSSVAMSPFVIENVIETVGQGFLKVAEEEVQNCMSRITVTPAFHSFIMQGTDQLFLVYQPMLYIARHRQQVIITAQLPPDAMEAYVQAKTEDPSATFVLYNSEEALLNDLLTGGSFAVNIVKGVPQVYGDSASNIATNVQLTNIQILVNRSLARADLSDHYPKQMQFYLYGTGRQWHIDHILYRAPNAQLTAGQVSINADITVGGPGTSYILEMVDRNEAAMQPFSDTHLPSFFKPGGTSRINIYAADGSTPDLHARTLITTGTVTLGDDVYVDAHFINQELLAPMSVVPEAGARVGAPPAGVLDGIRGGLRDVSKRSGVALSHDLDGALARHPVSVGGYRLVSGRRVGGVPVSRFFVERADDEASRLAEVRREWQRSLDTSRYGYGGNAQVV